MAATGDEPRVHERVHSWLHGREVFVAPFIVIIVIIVAVVVIFTIVNPGRPDGAEITLADPPSGTQENPHTVNAMGALEAPGRKSGAEYLYSQGLQWTSESNPAGGHGYFQECAAFFPMFAPCQRALGISAGHQRHVGNAGEAATALRAYLQLVPNAEDRAEIERLLGYLEEHGANWSGWSQSTSGDDGRRMVWPPPGVKKTLNECETDCGYLSVHVIGVEGCRVAIDGKDLGVAPIAKRKVPAGRSDLIVICSDGNTFHEILSLEVGESRALLIEPDRVE